MIVLDTQVPLWWLHDPNRLSTKVRNAIEESDALRVSAISIWEIAVKTKLGKLALPLEINAWYHQAVKYPGLIVEPLLPLDAIASTLLPGDFHKDPADRIIIALARRYKCQLVTSDKNILAYPHVQTCWGLA